MAPWFAFGPSFAACILATAPWSIVPSSNLGFFFGPGLPRILGAPSSDAADRFAPFFRPSTGGGIDGVAGFSSAAGVAAVESVAGSPLETPDAAWLADTEGEETDSLVSADPFDAGDLDSEEAGCNSWRNRDEETLRVTTNLGLPPDLRRPSPLEAMTDGVGWLSDGVVEMGGDDGFTVKTLVILKKEKKCVKRERGERERERELE